MEPQGTVKTNVTLVTSLFSRLPTASRPISLCRVLGATSRSCDLTRLQLAATVESWKDFPIPPATAS